MHLSSRQMLRSKLRAERSHYSTEEVEHYSQKISESLVHAPLWKEATYIGIYASFENEVSTAYLIQEIWKSGKRAYLPVISHCEERGDTAIQTSPTSVSTTPPFGHPSSGGEFLSFAHHAPETTLHNNHLGILEPESPTFFPKENLDIVLVPLVGFDEKGNRLGMGAGYYDRTFAAFLNKEKRPPKPLLIGLAYEMQKTEQLEIEEWDVKLDVIVTEQTIYCPKH